MNFYYLLVVVFFVGTNGFPDYYRHVKVTSDNLQNLKRARGVRDVGETFDKIIDEMQDIYGDLETYLNGEEDNSVLDDINSWPANHTDITTKTFQVGNNVTVQKNTTVVKITIDNSTGVAVFTSTGLVDEKDITNLEGEIEIDFVDDIIDDQEDDHDDSSSDSSDWLDIDKEECFDDSECEENEFCDSEGYWFWPNECSECFGMDTLCNRNGECCEDYMCVWGRCQIDVQLGEVGTFCEMDNDCLDGKCCAYEEGLGQVCKEMGTNGMECSNAKDTFFASFIGVPPTECPCSTGLQCLPESSGFFSTSYCKEVDNLGGTTMIYNKLGPEYGPAVDGPKDNPMVAENFQELPEANYANQEQQEYQPDTNNFLEKLEEIENEIEDFQTEDEYNDNPVAAENLEGLPEENYGIPEAKEYVPETNEPFSNLAEELENAIELESKEREDVWPNSNEYAQTEMETENALEDFDEDGEDDKLEELIENYEKIFEDEDENDDDVGDEYLGGTDEGDEEWFEEAMNGDGFQMTDTDAEQNEYIDDNDGDNDIYQNELENLYEENTEGDSGDDDEEWFEEAKNGDGFQMTDTDEGQNEYIENDEANVENDIYQNELQNLYEENTEEGDDDGGDDGDEWFEDQKDNDGFEDLVNAEQAEYPDNYAAAVDNIGEPQQTGLTENEDFDNIEQIPNIENDLETDVDEINTPNEEFPAVVVDQGQTNDMADETYIYQGPYRTDDVVGDGIATHDVIGGENSAPKEEEAIFM
ncbi:uncharacterized protein LOC144452615 isoform X2 [Glandiceps talaboti]